MGQLSDGSHGSWVTRVMGQLSDGSHELWVTKYDPLSAVAYNDATAHGDVAVLCRSTVSRRLSVFLLVSCLTMTVLVVRLIYRKTCHDFHGTKRG